MNPPILILIETTDPVSSRASITKIKETLEATGDVVFLASLPSDGPVGHLLRVADQDRVDFDQYTRLALSVIDGIDFFQNSTHGTNKIQIEADIILLVSSFSLRFTDLELNESQKNWLSEICRILKQPDLLILCPDAEPAASFFTRIWEHINIQTLAEFLSKPHLSSRQEWRTACDQE